MTETIPTPKAVVSQTVQKFTRPRPAQPAGAPTPLPPVIISRPQPKLVQKLSVQAKPQTPQTTLRTDGPTLEEYVAAGYDPESYPPEGYAVRKTVYRFAKLRGTAGVTVFPDGTSHQWIPKRTHGGGYLPTTSFETTDAALANKLREAAKTDSSIKEAPSR